MTIEAQWQALEAESIDLGDFILTPELAAALIQKQVWSDAERDWLRDQATAIRPLTRVALELAAQRAATEDTPVATSDVVPGEIARALRPKTHGLLLVYPLVQPVEVPAQITKDKIVVATAQPIPGMDKLGPPSVGLAISFPDSESATRVEYQVNKRWNPELTEEPADNDD
jgi:hypothetical protein